MSKHDTESSREKKKESMPREFQYIYMLIMTKIDKSFVNLDDKCNYYNYLVYKVKKNVVY